MRLDLLSALHRRRALDVGAGGAITRHDTARIDAFAEPDSLRTTPLPKPAHVFEPLAALPPVAVEPPDRLPEPEPVLQGWWNQAMELFQNRSSTREVSRARKTVEAVRALEPRFAAMSDAELRLQTETFRAHIRDATAHEAAAHAQALAALEKADYLERPRLEAASEKAQRTLYRAEQKALDAILPEAFATAREAARRASGMFPYEVQVLAGALLHRGIVAEMYTGEGKTLAAVMPAYLAALTGHGFHIATVNDYLAARDATDMGRIFGFLGLSVGVVQSNGRQSVRAGEADAKLEPATRKNAYLADITYGTATELGFDYLRDNGVRDLSERVQRPLYGIIADEVDAILIDEARVPLIIAEPGPEPDVDALTRARDAVADLEWETDVEWDSEERWVGPTEKGADKLAAKLGIESLYEVEHGSTGAYIHDALQARFLFRADQDYTVINDKVLTIGKNGHAQEGRRYTHGLHQAIEAKEGVPILADTRTRASIAMRDYLGLYARRSGMTGTALSASNVFSTVYGLDVVRVPQRKKLIRVDHPDRVFRTWEQKLRTFVDDVVAVHATGRPILVGVEWTSTADQLLEELERRGVPARALTAKNDAEEAEIIAGAGRIGAVTVVTPRGGRGVDIKLGGSHGPNNEAARAQVMGLGGLLVMGFEHMDSRRRDDQLRGRAARQGDPGATVFYTSIEDPLFDGVVDAEAIRKGEKPFSEAVARMVTERALDHSENRINDELTQTVPYDDVLALHRNVFYEMRDAVLSVPDCRELVQECVGDALENVFQRIDAVGSRSSIIEPLDERLARDLYFYLAALLPLPDHGPPPDWTGKTLGQIRDDIDVMVNALLKRRDAAVGEEINRVLERAALLEALDQSWIEHLDMLAHIRQSIGFRAYGQKDPRREFRSEAHLEYQALVTDIRSKVTARLLKNMPYIAGGDHAE